MGMKGPIGKGKRVTYSAKMAKAIGYSFTGNKCGIKFDP